MLFELANLMLYLLRPNAVHAAEQMYAGGHGTHGVWHRHLDLGAGCKQKQQQLF